MVPRPDHPAWHARGHRRTSQGGEDARAGRHHGGAGLPRRLAADVGQEVEALRRRILARVPAWDGAASGGDRGGRRMMDSTLAVLEEALAFGDTIVIVRAGAAIAEIMGGPARRGQEWLTVGDEGAGASHVHIKLSEIDALRFRHADGHNAALDVLNANGEGIVSLSFRKTNAGRAETFDADRLAIGKARFGHLAEVPA